MWHTLLSMKETIAALENRPGAGPVKEEAPKILKNIKDAKDLDQVVVDQVMLFKKQIDVKVAEIEQKIQ